MNPAPPAAAGERRDRLLLLDGHSVAYRAFFALPPENFSTTTGQPTNAVYGFTAMLINVLRDEQPTHVAVAFDRGEPTFRHEQYVEYKATRRESPADFRSQLSLIFEVLDALGIPRLSVAGFEADDIIATLATQATKEGLGVLIVSGDRDTLQLVNDDVTVLMTRRGISDMTRFTPAEVTAKYGLTPAQYPDFAALRGDPSDNLPNIPGVGEKTAAKWIAEYGSLAQLVDQVDQVKGRAGDRLREHLGDVLRNRQLTELARDVPLELGPAARRRGTGNRSTSSLTPSSSASCVTAFMRRCPTASLGRSRPRRDRTMRRRQPSTWMCRSCVPGRWPPGWPSMPTGRAGPGSPPAEAGDGARARSQRWPWRPLMVRARSSTRWR